jgi:hypothetical protein
VAKSTINVTITGETRGLERALGNAESKLSRFGSGIKTGLKVGGAALAGIGGAAVLAAPKILEMGTELEALGQKSRTVFGDSLGDVETWAKGTANSMGLTTDQLIGAAAGTADLLKPMGFASDEAAALAMQTNDLAGALSAWTGGQQSAEQVSDTLTKAYLGERDGLKSLGISISEADVQSRLAAKGQDKLTGAALEQAKAMATMEMIFEKSQDAQTAWSDGSMDSVKAMNRSKASLEEVKQGFAKALLPAIQAVLPVVEKLATWLGEHLPPAIEKVTTWFRENWPRIKQTAIDTMEAIRNVIEQVWKRIEGIVRGAIDVVKGIIDTVMAVIRGDWGDAWDGIVKILDGVWEIIKGAVKLAGEAVVKLLGLAWEALKRAVSAAWDWVTREIGEAIDGIVDTVSDLPGDILSGLGALGGFLVDKGRELIDGILTGASEFVTDTLIPWITGIPQAAVDALVGIGGWLIEKGRQLVNGLLSGAREKWGEFTSWLSGRIGDVQRMFHPLRQAAYDTGRAIADALSGRVPGYSSRSSGPSTPRGGGTWSATSRNTGGMVPGPIGSPQLILAHGGERVLPTHKKGYARDGGGMNIHLTVNAGVGTDGFAVGQQIVTAIRQYERANGAGWRAA